MAHVDRRIADLPADGGPLLVGRTRVRPPAGAQSSRRPQRAKPDYRALFESAPGMFLVLDPELTIVAVSDAYLRATMTSRAEIVGRGLFEVFPDNPDDPGATGVDNLAASLDRVRASLVPDTMAVQKYDIRRRDDEGGGFEVRFWSPVNTPVLTGDGRLAYIIHRVEDVTEFVRLRNLGTEHIRVTEELRSRTAEMEAEVYSRAQELGRSNRDLHRANAELQRARAFVDSLFENLPHMVSVKDARDLRYLRLNRAGEDLLGLQRADMIGRDDHAFMTKAEADAAAESDRAVLLGRRVVDIPEQPIETERGRRILHTKKIPILDEHGVPEYLLAISEDITERKVAEDELRRARHEAERANLAKTEFLSRMSHELRTPLNAILGFSQLLDLDDLEAGQRESVAYISAAGNHLLGLINEILDISRIESGQLTISSEPVLVDELLGEVLALVRPLAAERGITISEPDERCWSHALADRQRLKQVLLNLLSNAIKYNRVGGGITLACSAGKERVRIAITDTGYGIAPESLDRVFRPFDRAGAELGGVEGTGIGLAVSEGLVRAMGGTIGVESRLGVGSTFWIELPAAEGPLERYERTYDGLRTPTFPGGPRRLILQVEDNLPNVTLVERVLSQHAEFDLITATLGREAIELARTRAPDVVVLDLHLPDIPGHEVLRQLRAFPETASIPVVVLSADATPGQVVRMRDAGAFEYLTKPLDVALFLATIERATARGS